MKNSKAISIIKNFPSNDIPTEDKKEALSILVSTNIVDKLTKNELYNAIIYLSDMVDFNIKEKNARLYDDINFVKADINFLKEDLKYV